MTVTRSGVPSWRSQAAAWTNSAGSEMLTRSPVIATWSGASRAQVRHQRVEHLAPVHPVAAPLPGEVAQHPLVHQRARADPRHRPEMQVGEVGEAEGHAGPPARAVRAGAASGVPWARVRQVAWPRSAGRAPAPPPAADRRAGAVPPPASRRRAGRPGRAPRASGRARPGRAAGRRRPRVVSQSTNAAGHVLLQRRAAIGLAAEQGQHAARPAA